jgi:hypothetical protein
MAGPQGTSTRRDFHESLSAMIEAERADMFTTARGKVISYDAKTQTAKIKPMLKQAFGDKMLEAPDLEDVHVRFPRSGGMILHTPLAKDDFVTIHFDQRSTEDYDADGGAALDNSRGRMNALSDCFVVPGCYPVTKPAKGLPDKGIYFGTEDGKNGFTISPGGKWDFKQDGESFLKVLRDFMATMQAHTNQGAPNDQAGDVAAQIARLDKLME